MKQSELIGSRTFSILCDDIEESAFPSNYTKSTRYTALTFLPVCLFNQFKRLANIYFLAIAVLQSIPAISPLNPVSSIVPLIFVIAVSMAREGFEDLSRFRSDLATNSAKALRFRRGRWVEAEWKDIVVGDVLRICDLETIPADAVVLETSEAKGGCFVMTSTLDGEKNLKPKFAVPEVAAKFAAMDELPATGERFGGEITCGAPEENLYAFSGSLAVGGATVGLSAKQLLLRGAQLRNTAWVSAAVVYTGNDTKIIRNSGQPRFKQSRLEHKTNRFIVATIALELGFCVAILLGSWLWTLRFQARHAEFVPARYGPFAEGCLTFFTIFVLLNTMIPISLIISVEMVKIFQAYFINNDSEMQDRAEQRFSRAFSSSLNEELGQIEYVFSDKTGTLTSNALELRALVVADRLFGGWAEAGREPSASMRRRLTYVSKREGIEYSFEDPRLERIVDGRENAPIESLRFLDRAGGEELLALPDIAGAVEHLLLTLALCHDCLAERDAENAGLLRYQGMSPDEVVLVDAARHLKYMFCAVTPSGKLLRVNREEQEIEVVEFFEFDSERKRSSILVRHHGLYKFLVKGADSAVLHRLSTRSPQPYLPRTAELLERFSCEGLRTLCYAMRVFSEADMVGLAAELGRLRTSLDRARQMARLAAELENELVLLGCSAVEDKLQARVPECIADFLLADIKVWMLTGDKLETAENIAYSCRLIQRDFAKLYFRERDDPAQKLAEFSKALGARSDGGKVSLIMEGAAVLKLLRDPAVAEQWVRGVLQQCDSVVCCRMSPSWKGDVVELVKKRLDRVTLAIGDGANDVNMIQRADIGVGLYGREGMRAVQASDYGLVDFKSLWKLLFVHGRLNYIRISDMILYFIYKNVIFAFPQFLFCFYNGFSGQTIFDDYYITFYNLLFTSWPVILRAVFDQDVYYQKWTRDHKLETREKVLVHFSDLKHNYPYLYYVGQRNAIFKWAKQLPELRALDRERRLQRLLHFLFRVLRRAGRRGRVGRPGRGPLAPQHHPLHRGHRRWLKRLSTSSCSCSPRP